MHSLCSNYVDVCKLTCTDPYQQNPQHKINFRIKSMNSLSAECPKIHQEDIIVILLISQELYESQQYYQSYKH